jgi:hypothetical protein
LTVTQTSTITTVPGLTQTFTVPAGAFVYVSSNGGLINAVNTANAFSATDIYLTVDGTVVSNGFYNRIECLNTATAQPGSCQWSFSGVVAMTAGSHTIAVKAVGASSPGGVDSVVSGNNTSPSQGDLSFVILKG